MNAKAPTRNRRRPHVAVILTIFALMLACCTSCDDSSKSKISEATFTEQAAAVRSGKSDQIRIDQQVVSDDDLKHLDGLEDGLRRINFSETTITDAGLARIAAMPHLVQLRLAAPQVTDSGVEPLKNLSELKHLHLIDVPLGDSGLKSLGDMKGLESLYLDRIKASNEAIGQLVEELPGVHLHVDGGHHHLDPHGDDHQQ